MIKPAILALCVASLFNEQDDNIKWSYSNQSEFTNGSKYYDSCDDKEGCYDVCISNVSDRPKRAQEEAKPQGKWITIVKPEKGGWETIVTPAGVVKRPKLRGRFRY